MVPAATYLSSSYRPDREYVDGFLLERGMPTIAHSLLQAILTAYFRAHRKQFQFAVLTEVRTQIIEGARYRVPDLILCPLPLPTGKVITSAPWTVLEILSPDDKLPEQLERFRDYAHIGVPHILLLDPENRIAFRFEDGSLLQTRLTTLDLPSGPLPFDTQALFQQLQEEQNEG